MFRVHCNKCSRRRDVEPTIPFQLTRCHHIICGPCLTVCAAEKKCPMCEHPLQTIAISRDMPIGVANYFQDPTKFLQLYRKISKFQSEQRSSDNLHFWRREQQHEELQLKLNGYTKMEAQLNQQTKVEKKRIAELREYIAFHERPAVDSLEASLSSSEYIAARGRSNSRHGLRPRTPSENPTTDNTLSDDLVESFCMHSEVDFGTKKSKHSISTSTHRSSVRNSGGQRQDFQI
ncbi:GL23882 [Drosophila persimilis]|uniref:GL23882 n=1 Tax=Drosophila persimilis TaxID=7234 RepID=B4G2B4_DROPE|nr:RING finger protein 212B [Drosophila persimilis]EDW23959.1 GL23882 [Drosophila persimilis]